VIAAEQPALTSRRAALIGVFRTNFFCSLSQSDSLDYFTK